MAHDGSLMLYENVRWRSEPSSVGFIAVQFGCGIEVDAGVCLVGVHRLGFV